MSKKVANSVEAIELEAEKILEEARTGANEILLKAKTEVKKILSSQLPTDKVRIECDEIISNAREEAEGKVRDSEKKACETSTNADKKVAGIAERIVHIIMGRN